MKLSSGLLALVLCLGITDSAFARNACVANYANDFRIVRSDEEQRLLSAMPPDLREVTRLQIEDGFTGRGWASPFGRARYDDMLFTLDFLDNALGQNLTPVLRAAVVEQFTSPVMLGKTVEPIGRLIKAHPDRFIGLLEHHVGAHKYWEQFSLCPSHSPYVFYDELHAIVFHEKHPGAYSDMNAAYRAARSLIPMRNLGGEILIIRRSYLPDPQEPRIRFTAPPCGSDGEPRSIELGYDMESRTWSRVEPLTPTGTWYMRGFEDPKIQDRRGPVANNPAEFSLVQNDLAKRFIDRQAELGLPIDFPKDPDLDCGSGH